MKHPELLTRSKVIRPPDDPDHEYYIPGYLLQKVGFSAFTAVIVLVSMVDIVPKLWTMTTGEYTRAEVVKVIRTNPGGEQLVFTNDAEARDAMEEDDRSPVFHNVLEFRLSDGELHEARMPRGSRLEPPYTILDSSGLPNTVLIAVNPDTPGKIVFPLALGTWFFPGIILAFGLAGMLVSVLYIRTATLPIQVPHLHTPPGDNLAETEEDDGEPDMDIKKKDA